MFKYIEYNIEDSKYLTKQNTDDPKIIELYKIIQVLSTKRINEDKYKKTEGIDPIKRLIEIVHNDIKTKKKRDN